jgi:hypothetical protein
MSKKELQAILGYLNLGLAIAHNTGVTVGHFGNTDFIGLAETVNGMVLRSIAPADGGGVSSELVSAPTAVSLTPDAAAVAVAIAT